MSKRLQTEELPKSLGLSALIIYGVGDMLGAGIYGLIGVAAGVLGNMVWAGFLISAAAALLTALSYASLGARYPKAGGAAYVTEKAFRKPIVPYMTGLIVMFSGLVSMAAAARAFAAYGIAVVPALPFSVITAIFIAVLGLINYLGMRESSWMNVLCTVIEFSGLIFIIAIGASYWGSVDLFKPPTNDPSDLYDSALLLFQGAVLTFYAFIGFEDLLNIAEEVKDPAKHFAKGILIAVLITAIIYIAVSISALSVIPAAELASAKEGPLVLVVERAAPWLNSRIFGVVALFAIANTALLNYVMASRLAYGMSRQGLLPEKLGRLHSKRRTPYIAILMIFFIVLIFSSIGDIKQLASATSILLLLVFIIMNFALIVLKLRKTEPAGPFEIPYFVPILAILINGALLLARASAADLVPFYIGAGVIGCSALLYLTGKRQLSLAGD